MLQISIDQRVAELWEGEAVLACCFMWDCENRKELGPEFEQKLVTEVERLDVTGKAVLDDELVKRMRQTFQKMPDMDPMRYRPASEALLRRCLDKGMFRINPIVDLNNFLSISLRLPLGVYDLSKFEGSHWFYRIGKSGEQYLTISHQPKSAEGKLILADEVGAIGSPVSDSGRAPIRDKCDRLGVIAFLPFGFSLGDANIVAKEVQNTFSHYFHPKRAETLVIAPN